MLPHVHYHYIAECVVDVQSSPGKDIHCVVILTQVGCEVRFDVREYMASGKRGFCRISFSRMLHTGHVQDCVQALRARRAYLSDTMRTDVAQLRQKGHNVAKTMVNAQENLRQRFSVWAASNNELRVCLFTHR